MPRTKEKGAGPDGILKRTLRILEILSNHPGGMPFYEVADAIKIPRSATHRLLASLVEEGYVRQERDFGSYVLTAKVASLGLRYLQAHGITDLMQPVLDRLAQDCGELVRVTILDEDRLIFVAKAQGARGGLRYDPDAGQEARLSCSSSGLAWLSTKSDEEAIALIEKQGYGSREEYGPNAPQTAQAVRRRLREARLLGYAVTQQTFSQWMNAIATPIRASLDGRVTGTISIAGPFIRLTEERMQQLAPLLVAAARELGQLGPTVRLPVEKPGEPRPNIFV
ncbi:IclR family transcriptional regulator [Bosea sp. UNC402CLCol]|uniref:IclR family transcriptional regulator n=1 Tax=Bosea sp. UNC402CLCol TaxID=1510531 RepID=UPI0006925D04|nr:IclR family transcriptional regulator [Bosea sp. UNC402CLCol]